MRAIFILISLISINGYAQKEIFKDVSSLITTVQPDSIRAHIQYLADDKLKGRLPGTPEYQLATEYAVSNFKRMGILPAGEQNSYLQKVILRRAKIDPINVRMELKGTSPNRDFVFGKDYVLMPNFDKERIAIEAALVFVGYGISAPEFGYDDYAGINVKGKIVVMVTGNPDMFSSSVKAHTINRGTRIQTAINKGAVGVIIREVSERIFVGSRIMVTEGGIVNVLNKNERVFSPSSRGGGGMGLDLFALVSSSVFDQMVNLPEEKMTAKIQSLSKGTPSSFDLECTLSCDYNSYYTDIESYNVVGMVEGSDAILKHEYIVHSAHLDHVGIGKPVKGDSIYNGAHDNASGVSCSLEVARLYSALKQKPKRSVLFVMVVGEEMGLLGSTYFATYPTVPQEKIVANINMDMPTIIAPLLSVVPLGAEHSSLIDQVKVASAYLDLDVEDDPEPEQNRFTRSDQYSFVKQGIPALNIKYGDKMKESGNKLSDQVKVWRTRTYHQPQDQLEGGIFDFEAGKKYVQLCFLISYQVAQEKNKPTWNKGDFFGEKFGKP